MTDMEKETVTDEILEETEQEAAEDMSQEQTDAQAAEDQPDDKDVQTEDKKRFFGKNKHKKHKQIEDLTAQLDDLRKRNLAEFENFRKRTEKEKSTMFDMGAKSVVEKLLPIIDNFERGFAGLSEEQMSDPFVSGMDMVYKQLVKALADMGVEPIEAVGKPFDPNLHNAVMHVEDENLGENTVAQEFQKGYLYHGSVVRHSMVQVAN